MDHHHNAQRCVADLASPDEGRHAAGLTAVAMGFTGKLSTNLRVPFVLAFQSATRLIETLERRAPEWQAAGRDAAQGQSLKAMALQATREAAGKET